MELHAGDFSVPKKHRELWAQWRVPYRSDTLWRFSIMIQVSDHWSVLKVRGAPVIELILAFLLAILSLFFISKTLVCQFKFRCLSQWESQGKSSPDGICWLFPYRRGKAKMLKHWHSHCLQVDC